jgi:hypothetical protein
MLNLQFRRRLDHWPIFLADAVLDDTIFEALPGLRDGRRLRAAALDMARAADADWVRHAILVLDRPRITPARLREEWAGARSVFRPDIASRLSLVMRYDKAWDGIPNAPDVRQQAAIEQILNHEGARRSFPSRGRVDAAHEILRILIHQWMRHLGPVTIAWLMTVSGYSYPTVAKAVDKLASSIQRYPRGLELKQFPRDEWARLLAVSDDVRRTVRFVDRSGQPRSPGSLLRRLGELERSDIAVGGVWGAGHYDPALDLVGNSRLDLSLHTRRASPDYGFVGQLDPGLERATGRQEGAALVVHLVRRRESFFELSTDGPPWADPVECLLDLHEARLESQARDFLRVFSRNEART